MNSSNTILAILGIAAAISTVLATIFSRSRGKNSLDLLQSNINAYKDAEKLKDARIVYLEGQLVIKDETIKRILKNDT